MAKALSVHSSKGGEDPREVSKKVHGEVLDNKM